MTSTGVSTERLDFAYQSALSVLLAERTGSYWTGELAGSALATATAVTALAVVDQCGNANAHAALIQHGIDWLVGHQNTDGGWGDTIVSHSNISTSMLCRAAFELTHSAQQHAACVSRLETYLNARCGTTREARAEAVRQRYGKDRTFSVPILTMCALAGLVDWREIPALPFELACLPQSWYRTVRLPVVSYALPALIAIGRTIYFHRLPWNPITRSVRRIALDRSMRVLESIQPSNGGFLEATPLTSFVTMSLASSECVDHAVTRKGVDFLVRSVRPDGSWPIDTNLATWVTTLACNALAASGELPQLTGLHDLRAWLLEQQFHEIHPYTGAEPGGWSWTDLPGSVPDADDTPGVLLTLRALSPPLAKGGPGEGAPSGPHSYAIALGLQWLLRLQNRDGGWPTFCRGWGHLPFDRSGPDLTAHALRAIMAWFRDLPLLVANGTAYQRESRARARITASALDPFQILTARDRALDYLARTQRPDGSWLPLWFGNQHTPDESNPTYGTARVLAAYRDLDMMDTEPARRGVAWLLQARHPDGGWGGAGQVSPTIEETALALDVLLDMTPTIGRQAPPELSEAVNSGLGWLVEQVEAGGLHQPSPIGFYFAKLWYFEKLYPAIFALAALGRARRRYVPANQVLNMNVSGEW